ncbi:15518_t:CDS:2 [Gigaspora margarita]|uniref:15518_t:CDS:1 n=1 Tax=Gigaspora margarita TaxID=4874 RepID=A0ABN7UZA6_GIGMA|nr:15518_t:CDS:2 [Gigaspora margarita]
MTVFVKNLICGHYRITFALWVWAKAWWEPNIKIKTKIKNLVVPYRLYMHICICDAIEIDNIESSPSTAINICYQSTFKTKTEYFEKLTVVITNISNLDENRFHGISTRFVSSFTIYYHNKQHLFILKIENQQCILKIYLESEYIKTIIEETLDEIWKKLKIFQKYTGTYFFKLTNLLVYEHINKLKSELPTCAVSDWKNTQ